MFNWKDCRVSIHGGGHAKAGLWGIVVDDAGSYCVIARYGNRDDLISCERENLRKGIPASLQTGISMGQRYKSLREAVRMYQRVLMRYDGGNHFPWECALCDLTVLCENILAMKPRAEANKILHRMLVSNIKREIVRLMDITGKKEG